MFNFIVSCYSGFPCYNLPDIIRYGLDITIHSYMYRQGKEIASVIAQEAV